MDTKKKFTLAFILLVIAGIALCIGGVWVPALLIPGAACLAGAFGMYQSVLARASEPENIPAEHSHHEPVTIIQDNHISNNEIYFSYHRDRGFSLPENPLPPDDKPTRSKSAPGRLEKS